MVRGGARIELKDFDRKAALDAIRPSILSTTDSVATVAISVFGTDSPYFDDRLASFWLAGVGKGSLLRLSLLTPPAQPTATDPMWKLLEFDLKQEHGYEATDNKAIIEAIGDPSCNGKTRAYRREMEFRDDGNMHITVLDPPAGSD